MGDDIIRATAKIQEAEEPIKQKPIIQIDKDYLSNNIRASIDSGRDNPFRPDGEIYKSADPIVDYYKYGPNQSRAQSPSDSQLLLNGKDVDGKKKKKKRRRDDGAETGDGKSCWRRWLFCCCCCFDKCCQSKEEDVNEVVNIKNSSSNSNSKSRTEAKDTNQKDKQTKIVVLRDELRENELTDYKATSAVQQETDKTSSPIISNSPADTSQSRYHHKENTQPKATKVKSSSKCIVS